MESLDSIRKNQIFEIANRSNNITIIDSDAIEELIEELEEGLATLTEQHSMMLIVCEEEIPESLLKIKQPKNCVYIYSDF